MPELPEVETVRRQLHARLAGSRIVSVELWRTGREFPARGKFVSALIGQRVRAIERRAKLLVMRLQSGSALTVHLKMTGRLVFVDDNYRQQKHDRARFVLQKNRQRQTLIWSDVRQFGFLKIVTAAELEKILQAYGPEPLSVNESVLAKCFELPSRRTIKACLLDQAVIAGLGNIYADEALHRAGIRPQRRVAHLSAQERQLLARTIKRVLTQALAARGTSARDYVDTTNERGDFRKLLRVYGRAGEACRKCSALIKKISCAQRGTHYCPVCQK